MRFNITHTQYNQVSAHTHAVMVCEDVDMRYLVTFDCIEGAHYVHAGVDQGNHWHQQTECFVSQYMPEA